jgi:uncharacterized protein DUF4013
LDRITEAFVWPVRDPEWIVKLVIIGLISLIPVIGWINGIGWMLATLDRLRAGEEKLASANFSHLVRGVPLFVVELVYAIVITAIALVLYIPGIALATHEGHGHGNPLLIGLAILLNLAAFGLIAIGSLAYQFMLPAIILATDKGGIGAGVNVIGVLNRSRAMPIDTLVAGLMLLAASFVSGLGVIACGIGVIFTLAYALAMQAWIVRSFEIGSATPKTE